MILEDLLISAGAEYKGTGKPHEFTVCCPFCVDRGFPVDHAYHMGLNVLMGLAHCFRCHWKLRGVVEIGKALSEAYGIEFDALRARVSERTRTSEAKLEPKPRSEDIEWPEEYERFSGGDDPVEKQARQYLRRRGISTLQIVRHKIGWAAWGEMAYRVVFPVFRAPDKLCGIVGRSFANVTPKYLNSRGVKGLWNTQQVAATAVVSEGILDALRIEKALLATRDVVAVARLGSAITEIQLDQLQQFERVIIFPDEDRAGVEGAHQLGLLCADRRIQVSVIVPEAMTGRDPGSMSERIILDRLKEAQKWTSTMPHKLKLAASRARYEY